MSYEYYEIQDSYENYENYKSLLWFWEMGATRTTVHEL